MSRRAPPALFPLLSAISAALGEPLESRWPRSVVEERRRALARSLASRTEWGVDELDRALAGGLGEDEVMRRWLAGLPLTGDP